jgi:uncharacterized protein DUF1566
MKALPPSLMLVVLATAVALDKSTSRTYVVVDTGQDHCYDNRAQITCPEAAGAGFHGQDAQYDGPQPAYRDNGDGTVTDVNTGLMWVKARGRKLTWDDAMSSAANLGTGGHSDWRVPSIKEIYSLIDFNGTMRTSAATSVPFIDTTYFEFAYGDEQAGERFIDSQDWSATEYLSTTMNGNPTVFGVNFADGRIKGYPKVRRARRGGGSAEHKLYVRYVRGNPKYGQNRFVDNGDGTVTDEATGLIWQKADSGRTHNWKDALAYAESLDLAGHSDWRLPNAHELQSIVDYTRAPSVTGEAAIDPIFEVSKIESYYWTGTTHIDGPPGRDLDKAVYVCFGRALGYLARPPHSRNYQLTDVHGAGAQRSDPKSGDPARFPHGRGPQGDDIRIFNYVRAVRGPAG